MMFASEMPCPSKILQGGIFGFKLQQLFSQTLTVLLNDELTHWHMFLALNHNLESKYNQSGFLLSCWNRGNLVFHVYLHIFHIIKGFKCFGDAEQDHCYLNFTTDVWLETRKPNKKNEANLCRHWWSITPLQRTQPCSELLVERRFKVQLVQKSFPHCSVAVWDGRRGGGRRGGTRGALHDSDYKDGRCHLRLRLQPFPCPGEPRRFHQCLPVPAQRVRGADSAVHGWRHKHTNSVQTRALALVLVRAQRPDWLKVIRVCCSQKHRQCHGISFVFSPLWII